MRKSLVFAALVAVGMTASAQKEVVKQAEREVKGNDFATALKTIQPALTDPSTAEVQEAWYWAGKAANGVYDGVYLKESTGQNPSKDEKKVGGMALLDAVKYYKKTLSLPDEKGKLPGKRNKDAEKILVSLYPQLRNAGIFLLNAGDYPAAYEAWEEYINYPSNPVFGDKVVADPDTIQGQIEFYQAIAMLSANDNKTALMKLNDVDKKGYSNIDVYRYGIEAANRIGDNDGIQEFAKKGYDKFGTQDIIFIGQLINGRLAAGDYDGCRVLVDQAIAQTPADNASILSQLYDILGNVNEQGGKIDEAVNNFSKAIEIAPKYGKGYFDKARMIYNTAIKQDELSDGTQARDVTAELLEAADLFKKAYELDNTLTQIPNVLYRLYYRLGKGYEQDAEYWQNQ